MRETLGFSFQNGRFVKPGKAGKVKPVSEREVTNGAFPLRGTVWFSAVHFWGVFHWVQYLVLFLVPPRAEVPSDPYHYQNVTCKTVITASLNLQQETQHRLTRFKSAQPAKDRTQLLFEQTLFFVSKRCVSVSVEEVQTFLSLIAEERIQRELDEATQNEKALCIYFLHFVCFLFIFVSVFCFN